VVAGIHTRGVTRDVDGLLATHPEKPPGARVSPKQGRPKNEMMILEISQMMSTKRMMNEDINAQSLMPRSSRDRDWTSSVSYRQRNRPKSMMP
jgi:hypothetical protein